jgi:hypothetical protein
VRCVATDTCETHQTCDYFGRLVCREGWGTFPLCNIRLVDPSIDRECPSNSNPLISTSPCQNGGSCWNGTCCCAPNYTGPRCELTINFCASSPCRNGGLCVPTQTGFTCNCLPGFSGILCQTVIDPCRNLTLQCSGAGTCIPFLNFTGFTCSCFEGFTGQFCEKQIDFCSTKPCLNNATCVPFFMSYFCSCLPGKYILAF